jgi:ubiquinone biosynthesis monooxygenase Coq7
MLNIEKFIIGFDGALRTLLAPAQTVRTIPGKNSSENELTKEERRKSSALMRINHTGEVCAQALYQGQALTAKDTEVQRSLNQAASEEIEHLAWTEQRITELGGRKSLLNPIWYSGSFFIGAAAGMLGDKWNLGFLAETERQVESHLAKHLHSLPGQDEKSRAIVAQMQIDEAGHANAAMSHGGIDLPTPVKIVMRLGSKMMTKTTYWI